MVQVIDRAFDILELLVTAGDAVSLSRVHDRVHLAPSTIHRILTMLVARGHAVQNRTSRLYSPGPKLLEVAARASTNTVFNLLLQLHLWFEVGEAALVVAAAGLGLLASSPARPGQHGRGRRHGGPDEPPQEAAHLGHGQRDQRGGAQGIAPPFSAPAARARTTVRNAWANSARVLWRYQPSQRRTS